MHGLIIILKSFPDEEWRTAAIRPAMVPRLVGHAQCSITAVAEVVRIFVLRLRAPALPRARTPYQYCKFELLSLANTIENNWFYITMSYVWVVCKAQDHWPWLETLVLGCKALCWKYTLPSPLPHITHSIYIAMKFSFIFSHFYSIATVHLQNLSTFIIIILR